MRGEYGRRGFCQGGATIGNHDYMPFNSGRADSLWPVSAEAAATSSLSPNGLRRKTTFAPNDVTWAGIRGS